MRKSILQIKSCLVYFGGALYSSIVSTFPNTQCIRHVTISKHNAPLSEWASMDSKGAHLGPRDPGSSRVRIVVNEDTYKTFLKNKNTIHHKSNKKACFCSNSKVSIT